MSTSPKIDLSSIMKNKNTEKKEDIKTEKVTEKKGLGIKTNTEIKKPSPKISLGSIKTNKSVEIKKEEKIEEHKEEHEEMKEELIETLSENKEEVDENIEEIEKIEEHKETIEEVKEIEEKINKAVEEETTKKMKIKKDDNKDNKEKENDNGDVFGNYKSDFEKKETEIIENIELKKKNLRDRLREPRTRILLVLGVILIAGIIITILFTLYPERHSVSKYKSGIMMNVENFKKTYIDKPWVAQTITIEKYSFNIEVQGKGEDANYKYKAIIYTNKAELDSVINNEVRLKKEELARKEAKVQKIEQERIRIEKEKIENEKIKRVLFDKFR